MNKLYRAYNRGKHGRWIVAKNDEHAKEIALKARYVRAITNLTFIWDESGKSWYQIFKDRGHDVSQLETTCGVACIRIGPDVPEWVVHNVEGEQNEV